MIRMHPLALRQRLEMLIGILVAFTLIAVINAIATHSAASLPALVAFPALTVLAYSAWRKNENILAGGHRRTQQS